MKCGNSLCRFEEDGSCRIVPEIIRLGDNTAACRISVENNQFRHDLERLLKKLIERDYDSAIELVRSFGAKIPRD